MPALLLGGCSAPNDTLGALFARFFHRAPPSQPAPEVKYVIGPGYAAGGVWYYPRENFFYQATGIAEVMAAPPNNITADGEAFDPGAIAGAHQTLQLPAIVRVTNLSNGRQMLIRLNARGPASPARVLGVTPRVAALLGFATDATAPVRVQIETQASQSLAHHLNAGGDRVDIATAPVAAVQSDALPPPPGARGTAGRQVTPTTVSAESDAAEAMVPLRLPETVITAAPGAGLFWIEAGRFGRVDYARQRAARLADTGAVQGIVRDGGETSYTVRIGPIDNVAHVDSLMRQVVQDGVSDARVVVE